MARVAHLIIAAAMLVGGAASAQTAITTPRTSGACDSVSSCSLKTDEALARRQEFRNAFEANLNKGYGTAYEQSFGVQSRDAWADWNYYSNATEYFAGTPGVPAPAFRFGDELSQFAESFGNGQVANWFNFYGSTALADSYLATKPYTISTASTGGGGTTPGGETGGGGGTGPGTGGDTGGETGGGGTGPGTGGETGGETGGGGTGPGAGGETGGGGHSGDGGDPADVEAKLASLSEVVKGEEIKKTVLQIGLVLVGILAVLFGARIVAHTVRRKQQIARSSQAAARRRLGKTLAKK